MPMDAYKIAVVGASGRMGRTLVQTVQATKGCQVMGAIEQKGSLALGQDAGLLAGVGNIGVKIVDDPLPVFAKAEAVLDFTVPAASVEFAALAAQARIVHVLGTTGFDAEQERKIEAAARHATIVKAGNMSLGVNLLVEITRRVAATLEAADFDIEIVEMHHKHKIDAPSGTALMLGRAAAEGRKVDLATHSVRVRDGHTGARPEGAIGFASLRGGNVVGEHTVVFAGENERVEITHKAADRAIFAKGAVKAALWGRGKGPGLFSMADVLGF
jgi:4-hydroxy-tetrahydrodipicolinate reductase